VVVSTNVASIAIVLGRPSDLRSVSGMINVP